MRETLRVITTHRDSTFYHNVLEAIFTREPDPDYNATLLKPKSLKVTPTGTIENHKISSKYNYR